MYYRRRFELEVVESKIAHARARAHGRKGEGRVEEAVVSARWRGFPEACIRSHHYNAFADAFADDAADGSF